MRKITIIILTFWGYGIFAQQATRIGEASPDLVFEKIINADKSSANLSDFKGKVIILDFWATWCGPCIKSLPELEVLQTKYQSDLQVITITSDPTERIERFLSKEALKLPVVIDEQRKLATFFPHRSIPHAVIIDKFGFVKAITTSSQITDEIINKVINGEEINIPEKKDAMTFDPSKPLSGNENFTYQVTITPYQEGLPSFSDLNTGDDNVYKHRRIFTTNLSAKSLFEIAYQFPVAVRTIVEVKDLSKIKWDKQNAICFELIVPEALAQRKFEIMQSHLEFYFNYKAIIEERLRPVKVLRQIKEGKNELIKKSDETAKTYAKYDGSGLAMENAPIAILVDFIQSQMDIPVIDETNLLEKYDLELEWFNENPENIHQALEKIGLELISDEREIKVLVIKDK